MLHGTDSIFSIRNARASLPEILLHSELLKKPWMEASKQPRKQLFLDWSQYEGYRRVLTGVLNCVMTMIR